MEYKVYLVEKKDSLSFYLSQYIPFFKNNNFSFERIKIEDLEKKLTQDNSDFYTCIIEYDFEPFWNDKVELLVKLFSQSSQVYIAFNSNKYNKNESSHLKKILNNIVVRGFVDLNIDRELQLPFMREIIFKQKQYFSNPISVNDLDKLGNKFDESIVEMQKQLNRVKDFHRQFAPKRFEEIRGIDFYSKFLAGLHSGGEFFDIHRIGQYIIIFLSSTSSYITSGIILKHYSELKTWENLNLDKIKSFIGSIEQELLQTSKQKEKIATVKNQIFISCFDLNSLRIYGFNFGNANWTSNVKNIISLPINDFPISLSFCDQTYFEYRLHRSEKLLIVSPGLKNNFEALLPKENVFEIYKKNLHLSSIDLINEIYYQLKKENSNEFLSYDASAILLEVHNDVITQV